MGEKRSERGREVERKEKREGGREREREREREKERKKDAYGCIPLAEGSHTFASSRDSISWRYHVRFQSRYRPCAWSAGRAGCSWV
jgi:hypothetical protein